MKTKASKNEAVKLLENIVNTYNSLDNQAAKEQLEKNILCYLYFTNELFSTNYSVVFYEDNKMELR